MYAHVRTSERASKRERERVMPVMLNIIRRTEITAHNLPPRNAFRSRLEAIRYRSFSGYAGRCTRQVSLSLSLSLAPFPCRAFPQARQRSADRVHRCSESAAALAPVRAQFYAHAKSTSGESTRICERRRAPVHSTIDSAISLREDSRVLLCDRATCNWRAFRVAARKISLPLGEREGQKRSPSLRESSRSSSRCCFILV